MSKPLGLLPLLAYYPQLSQLQDALKASSRRRVFLVGGALRDYYLQRSCRDLDFAVDRDAIGLARRLARRIKGAFVELDSEHGSARVVKKINGQIWTFDLTDWRAGTIQKDLRLRDFTINTLAVDIGKLKETAVLLEVKSARRDLKTRIVRMVSRDVFKDDPLRLLRAFTLRATLDFTIESKTAAQIKKDAHLIGSVAMEFLRS